MRLDIFTQSAALFSHYWGLSEKKLKNTNAYNIHNIDVMGSNLVFRSLSCR